MLKILLASLLAAALVLPFNRFMQTRLGVKGLLFTAPFWEEVAKNGVAYLMGSPLLPVHLGFGVVEACSDWVRGKQNRLYNALLSLGVHGIFGLLATMGACLAAGFTFTYAITYGWRIAHYSPGALCLGLAVSTVFHWLWNRRVISVT